MAIEIILRDDITNYKPKPFAGMTWKQAGTVAVALAVGGLLWFVFGYTLGLDYQIVGLMIVAACAIIGAFGLYEKDGVSLLQLIRYEKDFYETPNMQTHLGSEVMLQKTEEVLTKEEAKEKKKRLKAAKKETEFLDKDGNCITAKKYFAQKGSK